MSTKMSGTYLGNKRVEVLHEDSGERLMTVAPKDIQGDGSTFSPTDLVPSALGSCALMTMAIVAERDRIDIRGASFQIEKHMSASSPRRIAKLPLTIHLPQHLTSEQRTKLEAAARACPVHQSLGSGVEVALSFFYDQ